MKVLLVLRRKIDVISLPLFTAEHHLAENKLNSSYFSIAISIFVENWRKYTIFYYSGKIYKQSNMFQYEWRNY